MTTADTLRAARALIEKPERWTTADVVRIAAECAAKWTSIICESSPSASHYEIIKEANRLGLLQALDMIDRAVAIAEQSK